MTLDIDAVTDLLRAQLAGAVLRPGQDGYAEESGGFDLSLVHSAQIVVAAANPDDVVATVRVATGSGLAITVIGGGHGDIPTVTEGILLTTRHLGDVDVDTDTRTARVGSGATWHDVMAATTSVGLAPLVGSAPAVGVGGFLLGGGMGPIGRTFGFTADYVRSFEIVGADGILRTVSASVDAELFWALRGGKGGFGVVTAATVELLELPAIYGGGEYYATPHIPALLRAYQRFVAAGVPDSLTTSVAILRLPDIPVLPPPLRGQTVAHLRVGYVGDLATAHDEVERLLAPLRQAVDTPLLGGLREMPYEEIGTIHNDPTVPSAHATAGILLDQLEPDTVEAILGVAGPDVRAPLAIVEIRHLGGAFAGTGGPRDAVSGREAAFGIWVSGAPMPADFDSSAMSSAASAVRGVLNAVGTWSTGTVQINFCGSVNTAEEAARAWPAQIGEKLATIRLRYDPQTLFPFVPGGGGPE